MRLLLTSVLQIPHRVYQLKNLACRSAFDEITGNFLVALF